MNKKVLAVMRTLWITLSLFGLTGFVPSKPLNAEPAPLLVRITQVDTAQFPRVTVYISVTDNEGNPVEVSPSQLVLAENGQEMKLEDVKGIGEREEPLITLLIMDVSGSMNAAGKLEAAKEAARAYVNQTRPNDLTGLLIFNTRVIYEQPITQD
ncbi:MAG: VWA domain-containing protein, partial [Anaerolineales bacterium]|nr:VWA domain-containing protein [Anaerolineales bacterium]